MTWVGLNAAVAALLALSAAGNANLFAQAPTGQRDTLRRQIERRFDVLPLRDGGLALHPRNGDRRVRSIEISESSIDIDGAPATGAELRRKLGADADAVLQLSYLDRAERQRLFAPDASSATPTAPQAEAVPGTPPASTPNQPAESPTSVAPGDSGRQDGRPGDFMRRRPRRGGSENDRVRFGGNIVVEEGEVINGDVVAIGGSVRIDGEVTGNAVAIGGPLTAGPHANLLGDAVAIGGPFTRDPGARIGGKIVDMSGVNGFPFDPRNWNRFGRFLPFGATPFFGAAAGVLALMGTLMRVFVLSVLTCIVLFVGRGYVERVGARAAAEPLKSGAIGFLAQLLFLPVLVLTVVVLAITIIGIPLLLLVPFAILALAVVGVVGFTAVVYNVGRLANARFSWSNDNPYVTAVTGILLLISPLMLARLLGLADWLLFPITGALTFLGLLVEYLAWTVGFGAVALLRFNNPAASPASAPPLTA
jgi:hypothetical protein